MTLSRLHPTALMIAASLALYAAAPPSHAKNGNGKPAIDPAAIAALQKMGEFLRSQQAFSVQARMTTDDVIGSGQKVQYAGVVDMKVRRPDRMRMNISGDRRNEHIFFSPPLHVSSITVMCMLCEIGSVISGRVNVTVLPRVSGLITAVSV